MPLRLKLVAKTPLNTGLMYVGAYVNDKPIKAMVDKGVTHNRLCG